MAAIGTPRPPTAIEISRIDRGVFSKMA